MAYYQLVVISKKMRAFGGLSTARCCCGKMKSADGARRVVAQNLSLLNGIEKVTWIFWYIFAGFL